MGDVETVARPPARESGGIAGDAIDLSGYLAPTHQSWLATEPEGSWREHEATFVFGDVSGFTALGERLTRRGRIGAETLTDAITRAFVALDTVIAGCGGEILKFGGDAVLAMFTGEEHQARGAAAALGMRDALAELRIPALGGGRLGMSIGLASGQAHLFLCGRAPRDLLVAGPLATAVVESEGTANAGEVVVAAASASALPESCLKRDGSGRVLLRAAPSRWTVTPVRRPGDGNIELGLPPHVLEHEPGDAEHRHVTVAFVKYSGSDGLLRRDGPAALAGELERIVSAATAACDRWDVTYVSSDVDTDGGKLVLAAGAPRAEQDDDDRILHAVREIALPEWALAVRAGVNRGPLFTADIGHEPRRVWSLMGDTVNLAARVMAHASPGTVLATPSVLKGARDEYELETVAPFKAKGKSAPVRSFLVGEAQGARTAEPSASPLVGRERELELIQAAIAGAGAGERRVVELVAEPGIGKSRLATATREAGSELVQLDIQGGPYAARTPYLALRRPLIGAILPGLGERTDLASVLRARVKELDADLLPWLPVIAPVFGVEVAQTPEALALSPEYARPRMAKVLARLLDLALPEGPVLLVVEDAHWLDEASTSLLRLLLAPTGASGREPERGFFALFTRRPGNSEISGIEGIKSVALEPLANAALHALMAPSAAQGVGLPPHVRDELIERSHGNPLLLGELAAVAAAGESLDDLPDSVEALMNARMSGLPSGDRKLLREASVIGQEVALDLLATTLERDVRSVRHSVDRLREFLVPARADTVRFSHALLREAAYAALPFRRRRELHGRAGDAIRARAADDIDGILAIHYGAARRWPEAWRYGRAAGAKALSRGAPHEARAMLRSAIDGVRWVPDVRDAEVREALVKLGDAAELSGEFEEARWAYARARRRAADAPVEAAEILLREGRLREGSASVTQAIRFYRRGVQAVRPLRSAEARSVRARLMLAEGGSRVHSGKHRIALPLLEAAVEEAEAAGDRAALAHAYYLLDWALTDLGMPEAERYRGLALPIFEELGDFDKQGRVLTNLGVTAYHEGEWDEALALYERARVASERAGDAIGASFNLNNVAEIRLEQGRLEEAEELFEEVLTIWRAADFGFGVGNALRNLARLETRRGNLDRAGDLFLEGREVLAAGGLEGATLELDAFEAKRLLLAGRVAEAKALAVRIQEASRKVDVIPLLPAMTNRIVALCHLHAGERERGIEVLRQSVALAEEADAIYELALALDALAVATGEADASGRAKALFGRLDVVAPPNPGVPR